MAQLSDSPNLSPLQQQLLSAVYGGTDPAIAFLAAQVSQYIDPSWTTGPTAISTAALVGAILPMQIATPRANLFPATQMPGDGSTNVHPNDAARIDAAPNAPTIVETFVQVHSPTGNVLDLDVDTTTPCDGPFGVGCALTFSPATGIGTPDVILAGRTIASWATGGAKPLTFHVLTDDAQPVDLTLVLVTQNTLTGVS